MFKTFLKGFNNIMSSFSTKKPSGESRESSSERSTRKKVVADDQGKPKYVSYPPETEQKYHNFYKHFDEL
jgi:hypothetical protein